MALSVETTLFSRIVLQNRLQLTSGWLSLQRTLYTPAALGIDNYIRGRERAQRQFANMIDKFRGKMREIVISDTKSMIFTEDLKNMIHIAEKKPEDMNLLLQMMQRFNQQNSQLRFGTFIFGPVVMRMYHHLGQFEEALQAFNDPALDGFFDQLMSFQVLMDLLLKNEMYKEVLEVFERVQEKQVGGMKFPRNPFTLALAACYKMNNEEGMDNMIRLMQEAKEVGHEATRRSITLAAGLALNQNNPQVALELVTVAKQQNYVTVRNIKAAALADLERPEDAMAILRNVIQVDAPQMRKQSFLTDVLEKVRTAVNNKNSKELSLEFQRLESALRDADHIDSQVLDNLLCLEIEPVYNRGESQHQAMVASSYRQSSGANRRMASVGFQQRPFLRDFE